MFVMHVYGGIAQIKYRKWVKLPLIFNSCLFGDRDESAQKTKNYPAFSQAFRFCSTSVTQIHNVVDVVWWPRCSASLD